MLQNNGLRISPAENPVIVAKTIVNCLGMAFDK